jgi:hypothetical protein
VTAAEIDEMRQQLLQLMEQTLWSHENERETSCRKTPTTTTRYTILTDIANTVGAYTMFSEIFRQPYHEWN